MVSTRNLLISSSDLVKASSSMHLFSSQKLPISAVHMGQVVSAFQMELKSSKPCSNSNHEYMNVHNTRLYFLFLSQGLVLT